jgi:subfamily B ATP-binding cassette protein MsbA
MAKHNFTKGSLGTYFRLLKSVIPYWHIFAAGIIATIIASSTQAAIIWTVKPAVDKGLVSRDVKFLIGLAFFLVIIFIIRGLTNFASNYCISYVGRRIVMDFRQKVFAHLLSLPASFYDQQSSGKLLSLIIYNIDQLASASTEAILTIVQEGFLAIGMLIVMFIISWHLTLFFIIFAPILAGVTNAMVKRQRKLSIAVQNSIAEVGHIAREYISGYKVVRTFSGEDYEKQRFNKATNNNRLKELKVVVTNSLGTSAIQIFLAIPLALIIYLIAANHLHISPGGFGAFSGAVLGLLTPIRRLTKISTTMQKGIAGADSVFALLNETIENDTGTKSLERAKGRIEYKNIVFAYPSAKQNIVLNDINLIVEPGQIIALVGHSGAGKSTLVELLLRFYDINSGEIRIDNINTQNYRLADLRQQFSFVSQHIILFNDTIARNIGYGKRSVTNKDLINAAEAAYVTEFADKLPNKLDSIIGEGGLLLSGGQRQRIAIARAILKDAPILILDEATSSLDTESEHYLKSALEKLMSKRTTLVIAHRLSTVEKADCIIVLDHGKIVEQGTHKELIKANGYYSKLYKMQFSK